MSIKSPITNSDNVMLIKEIPTSFIIEKYKTQLNIDVTDILKETSKITIYKCLDTGYMFYYPLFVAGGDLFYQELEKFPWYYADWKWEYDAIINLVKKNDKVLEIGCGLGNFIKKIATDGVIAEGLEMNSRALKDCVNSGLSVYSDSIEIFSNKRESYYDIVCSFQVLEHVPNVHDFIKASLKVLKPGGTMIISVPNNDSLIFKSNDISLNMPPHHMGLWDTNSLIKLQKYFDMKVEFVYLEPLQPIHFGFIQKTFKEKTQKILNIKWEKFLTLVSKLYFYLFYFGIKSISKDIVGHSVIIVFKKND